MMPSNRTPIACAVLSLLLMMTIGLLGCDTPDPFTPTSSVVTTETPTPFPLTGSLPLARKVAAPAQGAYVGGYVPPAPFQLERVDQFERETGKSNAIVMWFQPWEGDNRSQIDTGAIVAIMRRGKVPMITWEPWDPGSNARTVLAPSEQTEYRLSSINAGVYDPYITKWARSLRDLGGPIMLRPMHEMNGNWYPWAGTENGNTPAEFVTAWRHVHDIFRQEGAANVTWVWSVNGESIPRSTENSAAAYYPGDGYVDWTGISGFNRGASRADPGWRTFDDVYAAPITYLRGLGKPICIAEMATLGKPTDREGWITDAYRRIQESPEVKAVLYFDSEERTDEPQDWRVETSREALAAYSQAIAPGYFETGPPPELQEWADSLSVTRWRYLTAFDPLY